MIHLSRSVILALSVVCCVVGRVDAQPDVSDGGALPLLTYAEQGWAAGDRDTFYTTSQGSAMMPYAWFKALRRIDLDEPFAGDRLQRYGYLPNEHPKKNLENLPIGFVVNGNLTTGDLGMTCAACHTSQIEYQKGGANYALRLDGAPAVADFQAFLTDLTQASRATLDQPDRWLPFVRSVLGPRYSAKGADQLRIDFGAWVKNFETFMNLSLPATPWGPGRLDAFGMIFNRVTGLDLGIAGNFRVADAPVSYPFLWNSSRQDRTQWNGSVPNGLYIRALARNTGEVLGVFANFKPRLISRYLPVSYGNNSVDFDGLQILEEKITKLRPPPWPADVFGFDAQLAKRGEELFATHCKSCHDDRPSSNVVDAWATPVAAVGTDPKVAQNAERVVDPGLMTGAIVPKPFLGNSQASDLTLDRNSKASDVLAVSVLGALRNQFLREALRPGGARRALAQDLATLFPGQKFDLTRVEEVMAIINSHLGGLFDQRAAAAAGAAYESRSLHGVWATAPYLHNGSVPNLWELLKPAKDRTSSFMVGGRKFDPKQVGYDTEQSLLKNGSFAVDPTNTNGNGNAGHEYGTDLAPDDRWAVVEYLKGL